MSRNDFLHIQIPKSIGSLIKLEHLNLSQANFRGIIPDHLGNLSRLQSLDLSGNSYSLKVTNLYWLPSLYSLEVLNLGGVDLSSAVDWLDRINLLPSLVELNLFACRLNKLQPSLPYVNFTSLQILDLSYNNFSSTIPPWLFSTSRSLVSLNLRRNYFRGLIPNAFENMTSLAFLDLSENNLEGMIPTTLGLIQAENQVKRLSGLRELNLSHNQMNGSLEKILPQFSGLVVLDVASNFFEGSISEVQLLNFTSLRVLDLSSNLLKVNISSSWIPAFQLDTIGLHSCQLGPRFPGWLRSQKDFFFLDISNANISDSVPNWFWTLSNKVELMTLSSNQLRGKVPNFSLKVNLSTLDLSDNKFDGPLPHFSPAGMVSLVLASNLFSGGISSLCEMMVTNNNLGHLDLSKNILSGEIPDCWTNGQRLVILNLANNSLSGKIPNSFGHLVHLYTLHLDYNSLSGEIPLSLKNCKRLFVLNLGSNKFSGNIPPWIWDEMQNLKILILRANSFGGDIPLQLCLLKSLKILDLSSNSLSGPISRCINNFLGMSKVESLVPKTPGVFELIQYIDNSDETLVFLAALKLSRLDLSSNKLSGDIPREITRLVGLISLNLSRNHLAGTIPDDIGAMESLEFLDLSGNELSCIIPASLSNMTSLAVLNLSHNRLSGKIPSGNQLEASSYVGNRNLCGHPLANDCLTNESYKDPQCESHTDNEDPDADAFQIPSFYLGMGLGYFVGFCGVYGTLVIKSSWRYAYYQFLGNFYDKIYVIIAVFVNKLARKFHSNHVAAK